MNSSDDILHTKTKNQKKKTPEHLFFSTSPPYLTTIFVEKNDFDDLLNLSFNTSITNVHKINRYRSQNKNF